MAGSEAPNNVPSSAGSGPPASGPPVDEQKRFLGHLPDVGAGQLRTMYDLAPIPAYVWEHVDGQFYLRGFNRAGAEMTFGFSHHFIGCTADEMYADLPEIRQNLRRCYETRDRIQHELVYRFRTSPDLALDLLATYAFVPPSMVTVFALDISKRRTAEREADRSRERYRRLFDNALVALGRSRLEDGRLLEANAETARMFGYATVDELMAADAHVQYANPAMREHVVDLLKHHGQINDLEIEYLRTDGSRFCARTSLRIHPEEGAIDAVALDITEWKRAEAERELLAMAVEVASESIVITDADGVIEYANPAFTANSGWSSEEVIGQREEDLLDSGRSPTSYAEIRQQLAAGHNWRGRLVNRRRDGTLIEEDSSFNPVLDDADTPTRFVSVKRDVTNEVRLERQLEQARKMEAIGRLAGGIAHDFNNLLTAILGHTELSLARVTPDHPVQKDLVAVRDAGERAARLTRQLLEFGRPQPVRPRPIDLNDLLNGMETMLRHMVRLPNRLQVKLTGDRSVIRADASQIERVVMNLVGNSVDAVGARTDHESGVITIETSRTVLDSPRVDMHSDLPPGEYVQLIVRDTGIGMTADVIEQMFEPFFTTKGAGEGTGLGLATVHGIVRQVGGGLAVSSEPGAGTSVEVWFPVTAAPPARPASGRRDAASPFGGSERVLAVEDDAAVRRLMEVALRDAGYRIEAVGDAEAALELAVSAGQPYDLLVTDLRLPGIGGRTLATELRRLRDSLPVICVSGYTDEQFPDPGGRHPMVFLPKPFTPRTLLKTVRETLDTAAASE